MMISPLPKIDLSQQELSADWVENIILNYEHRQKMYELSSKRAEALVTMTEEEYNKYKQLRNTEKSA